MYGARVGSVPAGRIPTSASVRSTFANSSAHEGCSPRQLLLFVAQHVRQIDVGPPQRSGQRQTVGVSVEPGSKVQHRFDAVAIDGSKNEFVHHRRAYDHGLRKLSPPFHGSHDFLATGAGQFPRIQVAEERAAPLGLHGGVGCHPAGGI